MKKLKEFAEMIQAFAKATYWVTMAVAGVYGAVKAFPVISAMYGSMYGSLDRIKIMECASGKNESELTA